MRTASCSAGPSNNGWSERCAAWRRRARTIRKAMICFPSCVRCSICRGPSPPCCIRILGDQRVHKPFPFGRDRRAQAAARLGLFHRISRFVRKGAGGQGHSSRRRGFHYDVQLQSACLCGGHTAFAHQLLSHERGRSSRRPRYGAYRRVCGHRTGKSVSFCRRRKA